jgi:DNA-binding MarR family transcriptional regulator
MSRTDLKEFLARRVKNITPEREELIGAVLHESRRSATRTVVFHAAIADRLGLNASDHKCADLICNETGPITAGRLAEITGLSTGAITGVVDRLEKAGFVSRVPDANDRRRVVVQGVEHGKAPDLRHLFVPMMEGMAVICESYTDEQLRLIVGFMQRSGVLTEAQIANMRQAVELPSHVHSKAPEPPAKPSISPRKPAPTKAAERKR